MTTTPTYLTKTTNIATNVRIESKTNRCDVRTDLHTNCLAVEAHVCDVAMMTVVCLTGGTVAAQGEQLTAHLQYQ